MKNILFITRNNPSIRNGGGLATLAFINGLHKINPNHIIIILADNCKSDKLVGSYHYVPRRHFLFRIISLLTGSLHRFTKFTIDYLNKNKDSISMCIFDGSLIAGDLIEYVNSLGIKSVTIHHNYEREYHVENKSLESFKGIFPYYIIRNEKKAYINSSLNLFLTLQDKNKFVNVYGETNGTNMLIGVYEIEDIKLVKKIEYLDPSAPMIISGSMNSYQTISGIVDFNNNYFSILKEISPNSKLIITGRDPDDKIIRIAKNQSKTITIIQNPINIEEIIARGCIYICPTNIGGGLKLRLMDGLKVGLPILVHETSARGYDLLYNKPWFKIYNNKETFKSGLSELIDGIKQHKWTSLEIQNSYIEYFSFNAGVDRLKKCLFI